jgi:hypothetical protein
MKSQSPNQYSFALANDELASSAVGELRQNIDSLQFGSFAEIKYSMLHYP